MNQGKSSAGHSIESAMQRRRTTLSDGRYLIFYTFGEQEALPPDTDAAREQPRPEVEAEEERRV